MNSKVILVAQREWLENVRTKAFWISLLIMPLILIGAIVVPTLLSKTKSAREFAVIDNSGWLLEAVEQRALAADLGRILGAQMEEDTAPDALLPGPVLALSAAIAEAAGERSSKTAMIDAAATLVAMGETDRPMPDSVRTVADRNRGAIANWWHGLDPESARMIDRGLSKAQFQRIEADDPAVLNEKLAVGEIFAYFEIVEDPASAPTASRYVSRNLTDNDLERWFSRLATEAVRSRRMAQRNVDPELAAWLRAEFRVQRTKISETGEEEAVSTQDFVRQWAPVGFVYLLWLSIFTVSQMLLSNTVEEKSNRLMEVLLSSVSPLQLMMGKIVGIAATGLTMVGTWVACLVAAALALPSIFAGSTLDVDLNFLFGEPVYLISFLVYFLLGYLLYAAILVAIGSVCNTIKEAQNLQSPIVILLMVPLFLMMPISQDPNGSMAVALSYFPPTTPFVMMNRAAGDIAWWEYLATTALLLAAVVVAILAAAKVFRVGVLMTGKPPRISEMIRWVRAPVGRVPDRRPRGEASLD